MLTTEQQTAIAEKLASMHLPSGLGDEENACSIAAINLALTGELTDKIPDCMSEVIGRWIIGIQDSMPDEMRNSPQWKSLLPLAAGTGREKEKERLAIILEWMWGTVLPTLQPLADEKGFGAEWERMTTERTEEAARAAWAAAAMAAMADAALWAMADAALWATTDAAFVALALGHVARAAAAWSAAIRAAAASAEAEAWKTFNPCGLLERLIRA